MNNRLYNDTDAQQPLLRASITHKTPPRNAFLLHQPYSEGENDDDNEYDDNDENVVVAPLEPSSFSSLHQTRTGTSSHRVNNHHQHTIRDSSSGAVNNSYYWGHSYATSLIFWCQTLPILLFLTAVVYSLTVSFLYLTLQGLELWLQVDDVLQPTTTTVSWKWLYITTMGGFLSGVIQSLCVPRGTVGHDDDNGILSALFPPSGSYSSFLTSLGIVCASGMALITGAPLGPEIAVITMAHAMVNLLSRAQHSQSTTLTWRRGALSTVASTFLPFSPILGPLLLQEVTLAYPQDEQEQGNKLNNNNNERDASFVAEEGSVVVQESPNITMQYMESMLIQGISSILVVLATRYLVLSHHSLPQFTPFPDLEVWHLGAALGLGLTCGCVGLLVTALSISVTCGRHYMGRLMQRLVGNHPCRFVNETVWTSAAGCINGLLVVGVTPLTSSNWYQMLHALTSSDATTSVLTPQQLGWTLVAKICGLAFSLGSGLIGGQIIPMILIGACLAWTISAWLPSVPLYLALPCCLVACPVSVCPIPLTMVMTLCIVMGGMSGEQSALLLIAALMSWTVTGGLGLVQRLEWWKQRVVRSSASHNDDDSERADERAEEEEIVFSEDEMLQNIRSTIFGIS